MSDPNRSDCRSHPCAHERCPRSAAEDGELLRYSCCCRRRCYISDCPDYNVDRSHDRCNAHCHNACYDRRYDCRCCHSGRVPVHSCGSRKLLDSVEPDELSESMGSVRLIESPEPIDFAETGGFASIEEFGDPVGADSLMEGLDGWPDADRPMEGLDSWPDTDSSIKGLDGWPDAGRPMEGLGGWSDADSLVAGLDGWPDADRPMEGLDGWPDADRPMEGLDGWPDTDRLIESTWTEYPTEFTIAMGADGFMETEDVQESAEFASSAEPEGSSGSESLIERTWPAGASGSAGSGVLIPFASGPPVVLTCLDGGVAGLPAFVGFGSSAQGLTPLGSFIDLTNPRGTLTNFAFQIPRAGTVTSFGAYFNTAAALSIPAGFLTVTAQLYQSQAPDNVFRPIEGTGLSLSPALSGVVAPGMVLTGALTGLSIPLIAQSRLMLVYSVSGTEASLAAALTGCASAGLAIN